MYLLLTAIGLMPGGSFYINENYTEENSNTE
jgi:hypothetical protein